MPDIPVRREITFSIGRCVFRLELLVVDALDRPVEWRSMAHSDKYAAAGVDYDVLDAGKRVAVAAALATSGYSDVRGVSVCDESRGESAFLYTLGGRWFAQVLECLGTKSTIARAVQESTGANHFAAIGYDTVAAVVNDVVCVGALPMVVNAYFATGSPQWYAVSGRFEALVDGWQQGCADAGATWGGGESPGLSGIVHDAEIDLAGCVTAVVPEGQAPILGSGLSAGDAIVLVTSNGIHANGISFARQAAASLPSGYATPLPSGISFGEAILKPSAMYVNLVEQLLREEVQISYISHITGHGFRKIMRADRDFTYHIDVLCDIPEEFTFLSAQCGLDMVEAYGTFNMGAGFAIYCPQSSVDAVLRAASATGHTAWQAGYVENGEKQVILSPLDITYAADALSLR